MLCSLVNVTLHHSVFELIYDSCIIVVKFCFPRQGFSVVLTAIGFCVGFTILICFAFQDETLGRELASKGNFEIDVVMAILVCQLDYI